MVLYFTEAITEAIMYNYTVLPDFYAGVACYIHGTFYSTCFLFSLYFPIIMVMKMGGKPYNMII